MKLQVLYGGRVLAAAVITGSACCAAAGFAQAPDGPTRGLRMTTAYSLPNQSEASRGWITDGPVLRRRPDLPELKRRAAPLAKADFGLSMDCAVTAVGDLADCRPEVVLPSGVDGQAIAHALESLIGLAPDDAAVARSKGYRVTVDAALATFPPAAEPDSSPRSCCYGAPPPPPPPPVPSDPLLWFAIDRAEACFAPAREAAATALFAAQDRLRSGTVPTASETYRAAALDAARRRQAAGACLIEFKDATNRFPVSLQDNHAYHYHFDGLVSAFHDLDRVALEVTIGALDRTTGEREDAFPF